MRWQGNERTRRISNLGTAALVQKRSKFCKWTGKRLFLHCDNHAVVDIWRKKTTKDKHLMQLVCSLHFIAARGNFTVSVSHIHGVNNTLADALSRRQVEKFKALAPLADPKPTPLPPNWESLWTTTFGSFNVQQ